MGLRVLAAHGDGRKLLVLPLDDGHRCKLLRRLQLETDVWEVEVGRLVADLGKGWGGGGTIVEDCPNTVEHYRIVLSKHPSPGKRPPPFLMLLPTC